MVEEQKIGYEQIKVDENHFWSQTSLKCIDDCPKQYFLSRILNLERKTLPSMIRGTILHEMIEKFWREEGGIYIPIPRYKDENAFAGVSRSRIANVRREAYRKGKTRDGLIDKETLGILWSKKFIEETEEMARIIYRRYIEEDEIERVRTGRRLAEVSLEGKIIFKEEEICYRTKIDEILPPLTIRDHKTGYSSIPKEFIEGDLQFSFYALALWNELQNRNSTLQNFYQGFSGMPLEEFLENLEIQIHNVPPVLRMREKGFREEAIPKKSSFISTRRNSQQIQELLKTILSYKELLKRRDFHQTTNTSICSYRCGYSEICPSINPNEILRKAKKIQEEKRNSENALFVWAGIPLEHIESQYKEKKPKQKPKGKQKVMRLMKKTNELRI